MANVAAPVESVRVKSKAPTRLARLPIPDLPDTLARYVTSLEPFFLEDEAKGGEPSHQALQKRLQWSTDFQSGLGWTLQKRLYGTLEIYRSFLF